MHDSPQKRQGVSPFRKILTASLLAISEQPRKHPPTFPASKLKQPSVSLAGLAGKEESYSLSYKRRKPVFLTRIAFADLTQVMAVSIAAARFRRF